MKPLAVFFLNSVNATLPSLSTSAAAYSDKSALVSGVIRSGEFEPGGKIFPAQGYMWCEEWLKTESEMYAQQRKFIMNGLRSKELFDCKRGLYARFWNEDDPPTKADTEVVRPDSFMAKYYFGVCWRVTKEKPYDPN